VHEVARMFGHKLRKNKIELQLDLTPDLPQIRLNVDKIKQVLVNLLLNAMQAVSESGLIRIASGHDPGRGVLRVSVGDNGPGVESRIRDKIFDPFFSTKGTGEGTGLGLSVSYGIIQDHGGEIVLKSEQNVWTEFTILLPSNLEEEAKVDAEATIAHNR
ncbi:MAG: sensor histidine kinase, partial [Thermodesulfobacteriota bacterium]